MGLDIALGVLVFVSAVRGWFRGFVLQAIRLAALIGSVYLASTVRDLARPYVAPHLGSIRPDLLERMLWWISGVACYLVLVGVTSLVVGMRRRTPYGGEPDASRLDQLAGFTLSAVKGAAVAAFLVAAIDRYAIEWARSVPWADEQVKTSQALAWEREYRPADKIWQSPPVQSFVMQVRRMGIDANPAEPIAPVAPAEKVAARAPHRSAEGEGGAEPAAGRTPRLGIPSAPASKAEEVDDADLARKINEAIGDPGHP